MRSLPVLLALALIGCSGSRTEVVAVISSLDLSIGRDLDQVHVRVTDAAAGAQSVRFDSADVPLCKGSQVGNCYSLPLVLTLIPGPSHPTDTVRVQVDASLGTSVVTSDAALFTFVPEQSAKLDFVLHSKCLATQCAQSDTSCDLNGLCNAVVPVPFSGEPKLDGGTTLDSPDLATPTGDSTCAALGSSVMFCEGFEEANLGDLPFGLDPPEVFTLDSTERARGSQALHLHQPAETIDGGQTVVQSFARHDLSGAPTSLYVRFYLYASPTVVFGDGPGVLWLSNSAGTIEFGADPNGNLAIRDFNLGGGELVSGQAFPLGRWSCFELAATLGDPATSKVTVSLDGTDIPSLTQTGNDLSTPFSSLALDYATVAAASVPDYDVWFDELIVDDKPIGCAK